MKRTYTIHYHDGSSYTVRTTWERLLAQIKVDIRYARMHGNNWRLVPSYVEQMR